METIQELRRIGSEIEQRRQQLEMSKNALCQKFGQLGSTKTYGRILDAGDDLDGMDVEKQLANYKAAMELLIDHTEDPEENKIYTDFEFVREMLAAVGECMQVTDNTRLILVTALPGGGKSAFAEALKSSPRFSNIVYATEATEAWRSKTNAVLGAFLAEIGILDRGEKKEGKDYNAADAVSNIVGTEARVAKLIERINGKRIILLVDEAHHLGPEGLNVIKTIINQTRAIVVLLAHKDLIKKISKNAFAETSQLWNNRLFEHIQIPKPAAGDVMEFLKRKGVKFSSPSTASEISKKIADDAESRGLWKFVKRIAREARKQGKPLNMTEMTEILVKVRGKIAMG